MYHATLGLLVRYHDKNNVGEIWVDGKRMQFWHDIMRRTVCFSPDTYRYFMSDGQPTPNMIEFTDSLDLYINADGTAPFKDLNKDVNGKEHLLVFSNKQGGPLTLADTYRKP